MSNLHYQRVLMGIDEWDRPASRQDEAVASRTKTGEYITQARDSLNRALRALKHRQTKKKSPLYKLIQQAQTIADRADDLLHQGGESYEVAEGSDPLAKALRQLRPHLVKLKGFAADMAEVTTKPSDGMWDPVQGLALDLVDEAQAILKIAKKVNRYRDSRGRGMPWQ
jgi:hypothetical protein